MTLPFYKYRGVVNILYSGNYRPDEARSNFFDGVEKGEVCTSVQADFIMHGIRCYNTYYCLMPESIRTKNMKAQYHIEGKPMQESIITTFLFEEHRAAYCSHSPSTQIKCIECNFF